MWRWDGMGAQQFAVVSLGFSAKLNLKQEGISTHLKMSENGVSLCFQSIVTGSQLSMK